MMIKEDKNPDVYFCCNGCQGVYHLLKDDGLDSFYDKMGNSAIAPPIEVEGDTTSFDLDSFRQRYIIKRDDGFSKVDLVIEGIHCAACVWLNEKILDSTEGVLEANINFTNNKAKIVWDEDTIKLSEIMEKIRSIGYNAYPYDRSSEEIKATDSKRDYFLRMAVAIFGSMNVMMIGVAKYAGFFSGIKAENLHLIHISEFIFATIVLFYSGWIFFRGAYYGLKNRIVNMDLLVSGGALITYIYSLTILFGAEGHSYFDSVTMIITFVLVGKYLEVIGKKSAVDTMDRIKSQIPLEATVIKEGVKRVVALDEIEVGDIIEVKNGEKASVDGESIVELSTYDESSLSGESLPIEKRIGDTIYSGTINAGIVMRYRANKNYANSTISTMVNLLEDSLASKPKIEEVTNEISKYFSITIIILSIITYFGWYLYDGNFENSLIIMISVIVIACPCALALATPIASLIGVSWVTERGLLFKEAKFIETFAKATTVVVDKTGTITEGKLTVKRQSTDINHESLKLLYALVDGSTHPVSKSIKIYLKEKFGDINLLELESIEQVDAQGVRAKFEGKTLLGGNAKLLGIEIDSKFTIYNFAIDGELIVSFELEDAIKKDSKEMIEYFNSIGVETIMATGDHQKVASRVAKSVGIERVHAEMSPTDKAEYITDLKNNGKTVVMVGDGINDALALSKADVAIVMGSGADVALAISDVVVLNDSLRGIKESFFISKRTYKFIKQNLLLSLIYNVLTIPLAMAGYVIPLVAALSMSLSSLLVVGNSARIRLKKDF
jgi:Cu+-exporting ATPase